MWIRAYDEVDPLEVYRLNLAAFRWGFDIATARRIRKEDPYATDELALYAGEGKHLFAQVVPLRFSVRLTTGPENVGGLAAVCSFPQVWGKGYVRRLLQYVHNRFREQAGRISTLTTSLNLRGHGVYRDLGYVDLAPFYRGSRYVRADQPKPDGIRFRRISIRDLPRIQELFNEHTRDLLGWTERLPNVLKRGLAWDRTYLQRYRLVFRDGHLIGYLRSRPRNGSAMEEVIVPREEDFRRVVRSAESAFRGKFVDADWITARRDQDRFRRLGYTLDPIADTTMAVSLIKQLPTRDLPALFGGTSGRFVQYLTDDF